MGVRVIGPEVVEQVMIVVVVVQLIADVIGTVASILLTLGAAFAAIVGQVGAQPFAIRDPSQSSARGDSGPHATSVGRAVLQMLSDRAVAPGGQLADAGSTGALPRRIQEVIELTAGRQLSGRRPRASGNARAWTRRPS
jgi:hypothetical protein